MPWFPPRDHWPNEPSPNGINILDDSGIHQAMTARVPVRQFNQPNITQTTQATDDMAALAPTRLNNGYEVGRANIDTIDEHIMDEINNFHSLDQSDNINTRNGQRQNHIHRLEYLLTQLRNELDQHPELSEQFLNTKKDVEEYINSVWEDMEGDEVTREEHDEGDVIADQYIEDQE